MPTLSGPALIFKHQEVTVAEYRLEALVTENPPQKALVEKSHQESLEAELPHEAPVAEYLQESAESWKHPEAVVAESREEAAEARKNQQKAMMESRGEPVKLQGFFS
jgi:hypothetical protein